MNSPVKTTVVLIGSKYGVDILHRTPKLYLTVRVYANVYIQFVCF